MWLKVAPTARNGADNGFRFSQQLGFKMSCHSTSGRVALVGIQQLWHVVVTQGINDDVLPVEWDVIKQEDGSIAVIIQTNRLPLNTTVYVWVRTPTADVLFVPYLVYPY